MKNDLVYLTVQDILWINLQVTQKINKFKYNKLEQGTFYQYGYGGSTDVLGQATRFYQGFIKDQPFDDGNEQTALVAFLAFLKLNGYSVAVEPSWRETFDPTVAAERAKPVEGHHHAPTPQDAIQSVLHDLASHAAA